MTPVVVFDVRGPLAHFRRPDTLGTHATYPFPTRTALRGLLASILGRTSLPDKDRAGLRLRRPVRTVTQELSLHGKTWEAASGRPDSFHRPTSIELIVEPHYTVCYTGLFADDVGELVRGRRSHFHTYLGSAFCLTFPEGGRLVEAPLVVPAHETELTCCSVVPADAVASLAPEEGRQYARVGGVSWVHEGEMFERRFHGRAVALLYEVNGASVRFRPAAVTPESYWSFVEIPEEGTVCLW